MSKPKFLMLMGIPASGKSTMAKELAQKESAILLSSDDIRKELFGDETNQDNNVQVFETMKKRTIEALKSGQSVVYDSTNTSRRRRKAFLNELKHQEFEAKKIVYFLPIELERAVWRNHCRDRTVSEDIIERMYKSLHIPTKSEGWDEIIFVPQIKCHEFNIGFQSKRDIEKAMLSGKQEYNLMSLLGELFIEFENIFDMPQDSKWHNLSISRHTYYVYEYILNNYNEEDKLLMLWAGLLHDTGKYYCKTFSDYKGENKRYASYYGHENCSAQIAWIILTQLEYDKCFIHQVSTLCQFHMALLNNVKPEKLIDKVGLETYNKLCFLRDADKNAH